MMRVVCTLHARHRFMSTIPLELGVLFCHRHVSPNSLKAERNKIEQIYSSEGYLCHLKLSMEIGCFGCEEGSQAH